MRLTKATPKNIDEKICRPKRSKIYAHRRQTRKQLREQKRGRREGGGKADIQREENGAKGLGNIWRVTKGKAQYV